MERDDGPGFGAAAAGNVRAIGEDGRGGDAARVGVLGRRGIGLFAMG